MIAEKGSEWISSGALGSLASLADSLPPPALEAHPRALQHRAEVARLRGEYESAHSLLRRAAALLHDAGDNEGEADALHSLATLARRDGDYELAFTYLDRATELSESNSAVRTKCGNTRGLCLVAMGEWTAAEREFRGALQLAEERNDEHYIRLIAHNLGTPAGMRGDFGEALRWLGRMLRKDRPRAEESPDASDPPMPREAVAHLNMARCYLYRGDFAACETISTARVGALPTFQPGRRSGGDFRDLRQPFIANAARSNAPLNSTDVPPAFTMKLESV